MTAAAPLQLVSLEAVRAAHERIAAHVHCTPLLTSSTLDRIASERLHDKQQHQQHAEGGEGDSKGPIRLALAFKSEHLQVVGAFKIRGATNAVLTHLDRLKAERGNDFDASKLCVVTHSSGNHAAAVACAARKVGARAAVVMPRTAPAIKKAAVAGYGARIVESEPTQAARESTAQALSDEIEADGSGTVVRFIHPYDEELVIAGQGTLGLEMVEQAAKMRLGGAEDSQEPAVDIVVGPVGGGGMLSGLSTAVKGLDARITVVGAEPLEADDAARSLASGELQAAITPPRTICDGLLTALSPRTLMHIQHNVAAILTVGEQSILSALRLVWERMKQVIEPSAAVGLAVVLDSGEFAHIVQRCAEEKRRRRGMDNDEAVTVSVGIVWTGGNVELDAIIAALYSKQGNSESK